MGKLQNLDIEFENKSGIYFAGNAVNGRVIVVLQEPMEMRGIRVKFHGQASTNFSQRVNVHHSSSSHTGTHTGSHTDRETFWYKGSVNYIETELLVWGQSNADKQTLTPGSYQFPFSFLLPPQCPSSFEGVHGSIRYTVKVTIDRPWKFDHTAKKAITVLFPADLNQIANMEMPLQTQQMKSLGFWCCKSGNIECQVRIPRSGYVPGETIPIELEVHNNSSNAINKVQVSLIEQVTYFGERASSFDAPRSSSVSSSRSVATIAKGQVEAGKTQSWKNEGLLIPPVSSSLTTCQIIQLSYMLKFEVDPSGMHTDLSFTLPITIGNIPLRSVMQQMNQNFRQFQGGAQPSVPSLVQGSMYPDLPPPSYQDVIFGLSNIKDDNDSDYTKGQLNYTPKYPYYNWSQQPVAH